MEKEVDVMKRKFMMFENEKNVCWLDASIALVAHNSTFKKIVENSPESQIYKLISAYDEATITFNNPDSEQKILKTQKILLGIQSSTLKYLKQFLKFKAGEPDSAFCALLNLIYQDKSKIKEYLNVSWIWRKQCSNCGVNSKSATCLKPIITLSKVDTFHPECPSSIYVCTCKSEQEMKLIYKELPPCLIFHFEKGVSTGTNFPPNFSIKGREYELTGIIILEKSSDPSLNHFVTWIRNPVFNIWLECNDLNTSSASFTPVKPEYDLKDVYIAVFEAFDSLDRINNDDEELSVDEEQDIENSNVELIDLSDEEGDGQIADSCEKPCTLNNPNASVCDLKSTSAVPLDEHKIETKSEVFDSQCKATSEFIETKEFKAEAADYKDNEVRKDITVNENEAFSSALDSSETSTVENLELYSKEKTKDNEEECISSSQNVSVSSFSLTNNISLIKHDTKAESDCQNKSCDDFPTAEATDNPKQNVTDTSGENKKEISSLLISSSVGENVTADDTSYKEKEKFFKETPAQNNSISDVNLEDKANARENEVNGFDENKLELKMKQISLKTKEKKCISPNEEKKEKVEDRYIASSKGEKETGKYVSSEKQKNVVIMNAQCAGTSLDRNEISGNSSESTSLSKDFDCHKKTSKVSESKNVKQFAKSNGEKIKHCGNGTLKHANRRPMSDECREKLRRIVDDTVSKTYAAFFDGLNKARESKLSH